MRGKLIFFGLLLFGMVAPVSAQLGPGGPPPPNVAVAGVPAKFPTLNWNPSVTVNVTYDTFRGIVPGGPYGKVNVAPIPVTTYRDTTAVPGVQNYYVIVAKDATGLTSTWSNEVSATAVAATAGSPGPATQVNAVVAVLIKVGKGIIFALTFGRVNLFG